MRKHDWDAYFSSPKGQCALYVILFLVAQAIVSVFFVVLKRLTSNAAVIFLMIHMFDMLYGFVFGLAWCRGFVTSECSKCKKLIPGALDDETTPLINA